MSKQIEEQISAFMDGELHETEHANLIHQICHDEQLKSRWQHYHLISDALKNNISSPVTAHCQFTQSVMAALENEPTVFAPTAMKHKTSNVKQKIAGVAIAASVAAVAVIGVQSMNQSKEPAPSLAEMPSPDQYVRMEQSQPEVATEPTVASTEPSTLAPTPAVPAIKASASQSSGALENVQQEADMTQIYQYNPQLYQYLLNHNQYTLGSHVQGVMPYARIVVSPPVPQQQDSSK
jgi:sigma-E factor negative regulatory protein RseA